MRSILRNERLTPYLKVFKFLIKLNPFWVFSRAWRNSGNRGAQFISDFIAYETPKEDSKTIELETDVTVSEGSKLFDPDPSDKSD